MERFLERSKGDLRLLNAQKASYLYSTSPRRGAGGGCHFFKMARGSCRCLLHPVAVELAVSANLYLPSNHHPYCVSI